MSRRRERRVFVLEQCEDRVLLADFTVINTNNSDIGSLRDAMQSVVSGDRIIFAIPTSDPGYNPTTGSWTIAITSALPTVSASSVIIDASTQQLQPGASTAHPAIELTAGEGYTGSGLDVISSNNVIRGFAINRFDSGILLRTADGNSNLVAGNFIGTDVTGTIDLGNQSFGVRVTGSNNTIGGTTAADRNLISGNESDGVIVVDTGLNPGTGNIIIGNYIGTDLTGTLPIANTAAGVRLLTSNNTVGGAADGAGNVVAASGAEGIFVQAASNRIERNLIGTNATGTAAIANTLSGLTISNAANNVVLNNLISGNGTLTPARVGLSVSGSGSTNNLVQGNRIGTNLAGTAALPNQTIGLAVNNGASNNTIQGNLISGNSSTGLLLAGDSNRVTANIIGTTVSGLTVLANGGAGLLVHGSNNTIGGTTDADRNLISGNLGDGIRVEDVESVASTGNVILGNFIGIDGTGTTALGNQLQGVYLTSPGNTVGGAATGARNVIAGNLLNGILVQSSNSNRIEGNLIGTNFAGTAAVGNIFSGLLLENAANTLVLSNLISGNGKTTPDQIGLSISGSGSTNNLVQGNRIGTNLAGTAAIPNLTIGLSIQEGVTNNTVRGNLLSGNTLAGIRILGSQNLVAGNLIGTDLTGTVAVPNGTYGVELRGPNNTIGGTTASDRNVISGNLFDGVYVEGRGNVAATDNTISGNYIGVDGSGNNPLANSRVGVRLNAPNNTVGGSAVGAGNVISASGQEGVFIRTNTSRVEGNLIGLNAAGDTAFGNALSGITLQGSSNNLILNNIISGNGANTASGGAGISVTGAGAVNNLIQFNRIGTNRSGTAAVPNFSGGVAIHTNATNNTLQSNLISGNRFVGVLLENTTGNAILGNLIGTNIDATGPVANIVAGIRVNNSSRVSIKGNVISGNNNSGNSGDGVQIFGSGSTANLVQSNLIGLAPGGAVAIGNNASGVLIRDGATANFIGGADAGLGNVISGNGKHGVEIIGGETAGNVVAGNLIGLNQQGTARLGNRLDGLNITDAPSTVVGPSNVFSGNGTGGEEAAGITIQGSGSTGTRIFENRIGADPSGTAGLGNSLHGVFVGSGPVGTVIGPGNVIAGNGSENVQGVNVYIYGAGTTQTQVVGNRIGTNAAGNLSLGGAVIGVLVLDSPGNQVQNNLISGHRFVGLEIAGASASGNVVTGNVIGTDATGFAAVPNGFDGVFINGAPGNQIGGSGAGLGNLISANGSVGIQLFGAVSAGNLVQGNVLGLNAIGQPTLLNGAGGIFLNASPGNVIGGSGPGEANVGQSTPLTSSGNDGQLDNSITSRRRAAAFAAIQARRARAAARRSAMRGRPVTNLR